jgi:hypothetical protein
MAHLDDVSRVTPATGDLTSEPAPGPPPPQTPASPLATVGVSGTPVFSGWVQTREERADLAGERRYKTYSDMLANVSIVAAGARYVLNLISRPQWTLDPPPLPGAEELATDIESMMYGHEATATSWQRIVRRASLYRFYGFSIQEWTAKRREDGLIGMADVNVRPQSTIERWDVDERGNVYGMVQRSPVDGRAIYLDRWKMIYLVDDALSDSPEGLGILRQIAEPVRRLNRYLQLEGWGFETDLRGIPIGRAPIAALQELVDAGTISPAARDAALAGMNKFLQGHVRNPNLGMLLDSITYDSKDDARRPSGERKWDVELLTSDSSAQPEILRAIDRMNREIARIIGVERLLLGENGVGSFAMAKDTTQNLAIQVDSTNEELREAFQKDFLGPIFRLNGWDPRLTPELKVDRLAMRDAEQVASTLLKMAQAGAVLSPEDPAISQVRDLLGLARPIEVLSPILDAAPAEPTPEDEPSNDDPEQ